MTYSSNAEGLQQSKWPLFLSIGLVMATLFSYFFIADVNYFINNAFEILTSGDEQRVNQWVAQFGYWGPIVIVVTMVVQMFLLVIPTPILIAVSVLAYGGFWGSIIAVIAMFCASTVGYGIGVYFGPPVITRILGKKAQEKVTGAIERYGFWAIIVTRLNPVLSNDAISFASGILKLGYWRFIGATLIGIIPLVLFIAYLGDNINQITNNLLWLAIGSLAALILYIWWDIKRGNG